MLRYVACHLQRSVTYGCIVVVTEQVYKGLKDYTHPPEEVPAVAPPGHRAFRANLVIRQHHCLSQSRLRADGLERY